MRDLLQVGFIAGVFGTLLMDLLNQIVAKTGMISKIDMGMLGRMSAGWIQGRFRYRHPGEMKRVAHERFYGYLTHYIIGITLAVTYVLGWDLLIGGPASPWWAAGYGIMTTIASHFFVYPSMGLGVFGRLSPEGMKATFSSLANHFFFGAGMAVAIAFA